MTPTRAVLAAEPLLTPRQVDELARAVEAGVLARAARLAGGWRDAAAEELVALEGLGEQAAHRLARANLRLVAMVSRSAAVRSGLPEADLFQEGCLGLVTAVQRFDHRRGHAFTTYALTWIRAAVGEATARRLGALNLPTSRATQLRAARGVASRLAQDLGRDPDVAEVAAALGRDPRWTADLLASEAPAPLEQAEVDHRWAEEPPAPRSGVDVAALLEHLRDEQRRVIELRLGLTGGPPQSLAETGRRLGLTVGRVRRIELAGLEALRAVCPQSALDELSR